MYKQLIHTKDFYLFLEKALLSSTSQDRKRWAILLIEKDFDLKILSKLLFTEQKLATKFAWFISEIGFIKPELLLNHLPFLISIYPKVKSLNPESSYANYWLIAGIPINNEAQVINLLLSWLQNPCLNSTTHWRAIQIMIKITEKYPELNNEFRLSIEGLLDIHSTSFSKKLKQVLQKINT